MLFRHALQPGKDYFVSQTHYSLIHISRISRVNEDTKQPIRVFLNYKGQRFTVCSLLENDSDMKVNLSLLNDQSEPSITKLYVKGGAVNLLGLYDYEESDIPLKLIEEMDLKPKKNDDEISVDSAELIYIEKDDKEESLQNLLKKKRKAEEGSIEAGLNKDKAYHSSKENNFKKNTGHSQQEHGILLTKVDLSNKNKPSIGKNKSKKNKK
jgi:hypothetical protein